MTTRHITLLALLAAFACAAASAQTIYRCKAADGTLIFSDHRCGPNAHRMTNLPPPRPPSAPSSGKKKSQAAGPRVQLNINNRNSVQVQPPPRRPHRSERHHDRGLPFDVYRRLETGMSEGQVLAIAGPPDRETVDSRNTADGVTQKSFYYISSGYNAFVTRIEFVNGVVSRIERTPVLGR